MTATEWPETLELTLDGIAQGGEGVGRWNGRVVFVKGGLPGEQVRVRLTERHAGYARGEATEIMVASAERLPPRLPGADHMPWQHITYSAQLRFKRQILQDQLAKIGGLADAPVAETIPSARVWNYRSNARFHVAGGRVGYHAAGSRVVQPITRDPLLQPPLNEALSALLSALRDEALGEVVLRLSEGAGAVVGELRGAGDLRPLARRWRAGSPSLAGVVLPAPPPEGSVALSESLGGVSFTIRPATFFQVNLAAATALLGLVREGLRLSGGERLLDLYCGAGTFTLPLAAQAEQVLGVDEHAPSIQDARRGAADNNITNVYFHLGRTEQVLAGIDGPVDAAVLDPPRRGCHPHALSELLRLAPRRIVYVSCFPATLARDLKILVEGGYRPVQIQPIDLFPQTAHIESVCVIEKA